MNKDLLKSSFFLCYLIFLIIGAIALMLYSKADIFLFINQHYSAPSDYFFDYFTNIGDGIFYGLIILIFLLYRYKYAIIAAASFLTTSLFAQILKRFVFADQYRPSRYFKDLAIDFHIIEGVKLHSNNSFPSGHSTTAFSIFCLLSLIFNQKKLGLVFFVCAFLAAYSRVYLAQHFFADIYFGSLIGVSLTLIIYFVLDNYLNNLDKAWPDKGLLNKN